VLAFRAAVPTWAPFYSVPPISRWPSLFSSNNRRPTPTAESNAIGYSLSTQILKTY
jgi:hypothetical protein